MSDGERRDIGSSLSFDRSRPGRTAVTLPDCDVPRAAYAVAFAPSRGPAAAGDVAAGSHPLLHQPRLPQLQRRRRLLPARLCTMKYNPKITRTWRGCPASPKSHPLQPVETAQGALALMHELQGFLGRDHRHGRRQPPPAAGAHGELTAS